MNDIAEQQQHLPATQPAGSPFTRGGTSLAHRTDLNVGAVAIEQERAIAEAQGKMVLAKRFPRSMANARAEFMEACSDPEFAAVAFYAVANRGSGPSIRFAEEAARCYGNFDYGHRELSRSEGKSEVEVYAWDMERNNYSRRQITVEHVLDTKEGQRKLKQQADIDNRIANIASKQVRGRILALLPKALTQAGIDRCKQTLAGEGGVTIKQRVNRMVDSFASFGVSVKHLEAHLGHSTDSTTVDELADLIGIFNAIKEGGAKPSDYFTLQDQQGGASTTVENIKAAAARTPKPAPAPAAAPAANGNEPPADPPPPPATRTRAAPAQQNSNSTKPASNSTKASATPPAQDEPQGESRQQELADDASHGGSHGDDESIF